MARCIYHREGPQIYPNFAPWQERPPGLLTNLFFQRGWRGAAAGSTLSTSAISSSVKPLYCMKSMVVDMGLSRFFCTNATALAMVCFRICFSCESNKDRPVPERWPQRSGSTGGTQDGVLCGALPFLFPLPQCRSRPTPKRATYCVAWSQKVRLRAGWAETPCATWACRESAPRPKPTRTWPQRVECQRVWARASALVRGAPLGGRICLAGMPWRTRIPTPPAGASQMPPPPRDSKGAPQKACQPEAPACARITRCATAVRQVSEISTTSARQSATVCQCRCRDVTFASATRMGPGWGSMSPHRNRRRGGKAQHWGGGVPPREP